MAVYYNEIDPFAAAWLRELIKKNLIAPGDVDERSITEVQPDDIKTYAQAHFFAGIGGWSAAARLALWPDDRPLWTGSCPCQPFSSAGAGAGFSDERHLWPAFYNLIRECQPPVVLGEQVASKGGLEWLDLVQADLEASGYATGAVDICAAGFGAPHIRQRLYWVADATGTGLEGRCGSERGEFRENRQTAARSTSCWVADANIEPLKWQPGEFFGLEGARLNRRSDGHSVRGEPCRLADGRWSGPVNGPWRDADWLLCRDGKWRPVEPGAFPLADGVSARVGRLRGYGNAIVPQVAAEVIRAFMECRP